MSEAGVEEKVEEAKPEPQWHAHKPGRHPNGKFARGNKFGPGNPFARQTAQLRMSLLEVVTVDEMREVARSILEEAKAGDMIAARLILQYALGKPVEMVNPDTLDLQEARQFVEETMPMEILKNPFECCPADVAADLLRIFMPTRRPIIGDEMKAAEAQNAANKAKEAAKKAYFEAEEQTRLKNEFELQKKAGIFESRYTPFTEEELIERIARGIFDEAPDLTSDNGASTREPVRVITEFIPTQQNLCRRFMEQMEQEMSREPSTNGSDGEESPSTNGGLGGRLEGRSGRQTREKGRSGRGGPSNNGVH